MFFIESVADHTDAICLVGSLIIYYIAVVEKESQSYSLRIPDNSNMIS